MAPGAFGKLHDYVARGVILSTGASSNPRRPKNVKPLPVEVDNPTFRTRSGGRFSRRVSAQIRSSEGRVEQRRDGLKRTALFYKLKRLGILPQQIIRKD